MKDQILKNIDYPQQFVPASANQIIDAMIAAKTHGNRLFDKLNDEFGCSAGYFDAVKAAIREYRQSFKTVSQEDARTDKLLRVRDSSGRATARRF